MSEAEIVLNCHRWIQTALKPDNRDPEHRTEMECARCNALFVYYHQRDPDLLGAMIRDGVPAVCIAIVENE